MIDDYAEVKHARIKYPIEKAQALTKEMVKGRTVEETVEGTTVEETVEGTTVEEPVAGRNLQEIINHSPLISGNLFLTNTILSDISKHLSDLSSSRFQLPQPHDKFTNCILQTVEHKH